MRHEDRILVQQQMNRAHRLVTKRNQLSEVTIAALYLVAIEDVDRELSLVVMVVPVKNVVEQLVG